MNLKFFAGLLLAAAAFSPSGSAYAKAAAIAVYRGPIRLPNFAGRDREYSSYRTAIVSEMRSGPNFSGHYTVVELGCGTGCRFVVVGDSMTGRLYSFPYGGEGYYELWLTYNVKSEMISSQWRSDGKCNKEDFIWSGGRFRSVNRRVLRESMCEL